MGYLNGQAMVLRGAENQYKSNREQSKEILHDRANAFIRHSQSSGSLSENIKKLTISPVFTAHPTNLTRPQAYNIIQQAELTTDETLDQEMLHSLHREQGPISKPPKVHEEALNYRQAIGNMHKSAHRVHKSINEELSKLGESTLDKPLVSVGNWVAGDRDGNPFVTADVLRQVVEQHADTALESYAYKLSPAKNRYSGDALGALTGQREGRMNLRSLLAKGNQNQIAHMIYSKIMTTRTNIAEGNLLSANGGYDNAQELITDLKAIDLSELSANEQQIAQTKLEHLILDIKTAGFYGATTDIRQNSAINEKTIATLLQQNGIESNYTSLNEPAKQTLLKNLITNPDLTLEVNMLDNNDPAFTQEMQLINSYKMLQDQFGKEALGNCITANTETVSDLLEVMLLLKHVGLASDQHLDMNIVGLIETVADLENASVILGGILSFDWYQNNLIQAGKPQMVMVGYSDSNRLDGSASSNWAVYKGTQEMMQTAKQFNVELQFFHGRGGTEGRGAGENYHDEIAVHDGLSLINGFRQTEQGEEVADKFGTIDVATANLSDMVSATMSGITTGADQQFATHELIMDKLANFARAKYRELYENPNTPTFYQQSTPINFVKHSNAGSRPAARKAEKTLNLDSLRAIPWTACWNQSRANVPAFFGTGTALKQLTEGGNLAENQKALTQLQDMYQNWPFFTNLVDRTEMALARADMNILELYTPATNNNREILNQIKNEYTETVRQINRIKQQSILLETRIEKRETLEIRNEVTHRANVMQANLLHATQEIGTEQADHLIPAIVMSMQAVANGLGRFG